MTFLNTLTLFNVGEIFVNFIAGLYTSVAKAYSLLMTFATGTTNNTIANSINGFAKSAYTLVGIFMVFRLAISILTYLIDPEKMSDKQVGASKLISRIVISVILLITLNTFIFPTLSDIENALLDPDSIIFNIFPNPFDEGSAWSSMNDTSLNNKIILNNNNFNIENTIIPSVKASTDSSCMASGYLNNHKEALAGFGNVDYYFEPLDSSNAIDENKILKNGKFVSPSNINDSFSSLKCTYDSLKTKNFVAEVLGTYYKNTSMFVASYLGASLGKNGNVVNSPTIKPLSDCSTGEKPCLIYNKPTIISTNNKNLKGTIKSITFEKIIDQIVVDVSYYANDNETVIEEFSLYYYKFSSTKPVANSLVKLTFNTTGSVTLENNGINCLYSGKLPKHLESTEETYYYYNKETKQTETKKTNVLSFSSAKTNGCPYCNGLEQIKKDIDSKNPHCFSTFDYNGSEISFDKTARVKTNYKCATTSPEETFACVAKLIDEYDLPTSIGDADIDNALETANTANTDISGIERNALSFARSILSSFTDKPDVITEGVEDKGLFMESSAANDALGVMAENKEIMFDWFLTIIAGLGVIVYLWILCIEVIIRNMKIIFLQIIAPIPVICYMNPNDKVLSSWFKQYIGTYLDLFIKLLAINAGFRFITLITEAINPVNGFATFLIYSGGFLFIKAAPTFISKVFGLENMAGTFKDAAGLVKTGLMAGAGAVAGGVAGAVSGMGKGATFSTVAGGLLGGAARGFSSGAKGKVFDGAKTQIGRNTKAKAAYMDGASWGQRMLSKVGMDSASRTDRNLKDLESDSKQYEAFKKHKESIDQAAEASNFIKDLRSQRLADGSARYSESEIKAARKNFINHNSNAGNKGTVSSFQMTDRAGNKVTVSAGYEDSKAGAIQSELTKAESLRSGSSTINKVSSAPISDYADLDNADTAVTNAKTSTDEAIYAAKSTDTYRVGDASRNSNSNNGNK